MLYIPIRAVGKESMGFNQFTRRHYLPKKSRDFMETIEAYVSIYMRDHGLTITDGPVATNVIFEMPVPKSWSKKKKAAALRGDIRPRRKPDVDNVVKGVHDSCTGVLWVDDAQVVDQHSAKYYGDKHSVHISVTYLPDNEHYQLTNHINRDMSCDCGRCVL